MKPEPVMINGKILAAWDGQRVPCKGCAQEIGFAVTAKGKRMPFNFDDQKTAHWATCPAAGRFKKEPRR